MERRPRFRTAAAFAILPFRLAFSRYSFFFGSYAKGKASATSDVDLLISSEITGLRFYELTEKLRESLHKKIDLLDVKQLKKLRRMMINDIKVLFICHGSSD